MSSTRRHIFAVVIGVVLIVIIAFLVELVGFRLFPLAPGIQLGVTSVQEVIASRPTAASVFILVMRVLAVAAGAFITARLAPRRPMLDAMIVTLLCLGIVFLLGLPLSRLLASVILFPLAGLIGARLAAPRQ